MKHNTETLLLAATVQLMTEARLTALMPASLTPLEESKWREDNLEEQAQAVLAQINMYADIIKDFATTTDTPK